MTEFPLHSYVLFFPPVGRSDKLVPRHRGSYEVLHISGAIYTIQDLGRQIHWNFIQWIGLKFRSYVKFHSNLQSF